MLRCYGQRHFVLVVSLHLITSSTPNQQYLSLGSHFNVCFNSKGYHNIADFVQEKSYITAPP